MRRCEDFVKILERSNEPLSDELKVCVNVSTYHGKLKSSVENESQKNRNWSLVSLILSLSGLYL